MMTLIVEIETPKVNIQRIYNVN